MRQLTMYWTTDDEARFEVKADGRVWRVSVPEAPAEQGYDLALNGKSLWLTDGREVFWNCGRFWTEPNHAEVMLALGLHEADVAEYREYAAQAQRFAEVDRTLSAFAHVVGGVHPRPGREQQTVESLRARARALLERTT